MCFSSFSNNISLVFIAVCADIKDIYFKVILPDLAVCKIQRTASATAKKLFFLLFFLHYWFLGIETLSRMSLMLQLMTSISTTSSIQPCQYFVGLHSYRVTPAPFLRPICCETAQIMSCVPWFHPLPRFNSRK